jgi:acetoin utilization protein AcuC
MSLVRVVIGEALARYGFGDGHPFGTDRMDAFWHETVARSLDHWLHLLPPVQACEAEILRFHTSDYLERVKRVSETGEGYLDMGDTPAFPGVYEAAATVVGSVLQVARDIMEGECQRAFVPIAGLHHARRDGASGFCVFNDIGVLIESLRCEYGVRRIAYVDIDAHHGDGVFYAFEADADVWIADMHEDGRFLFPGTGGGGEQGSGAAAGTKLNIPLRPGATDAEFQEAWPQVEAHVRAAAPEFIILQCGADSLAGDPVTHMRFTQQAHAHAAASLCRLADELADGRLLALGGGGYNRANIAAAWNAVLEELVAV